MDLDPSLSLTAEGLWSDEESLYNPNSDSDDQDLSTSTPSAPAKRKVPLSLSFEALTIGPPTETWNLSASTNQESALSCYLVICLGGLDYSKRCSQRNHSEGQGMFPGVYFIESHSRGYGIEGWSCECFSECRYVISEGCKYLDTSRENESWPWVLAAGHSMLWYVFPSKRGWWVDYYSGVRLDSSDLNVVYERSIIHAEHGSAKKVRTHRDGANNRRLTGSRLFWVRIPWTWLWLAILQKYIIPTDGIKRQ